MTDPYETLGVSKDASPADQQIAIYERALKLLDDVHFDAAKAGPNPATRSPFEEYEDFRNMVNTSQFWRTSTFR